MRAQMNQEGESISQAAGRFIASMRHEDLPPAAEIAISNALTDYAAVTILGADEEAVRIIRGLEPVSGNPPSQQARLFFSDATHAPRSAALINGVAGHAHDYDDIGIAYHPAHPSVAIAPALFAQGEVQDASGKDMIAAYACAYEVWSELASRDAHPHHKRGFHPTGAFGAVAAAAGVAHLLRLDAHKAVAALAIAASQSAGLVANFGTMTKPFHAGHAAAAGFMAAHYARAGMAAAADIFEHQHGFLRAFSPEGAVDLQRPCHYMKHWDIIERGIGIKLYPMCYGTHRIIHTLTNYAREQDLQADEIESVVFRTAPSRVIPLVHTNPVTPLDAKFSAEFAIAQSVIARRSTLSDLSEDFLNRSDVRVLMARVTRDLDPALESGFTQEPDDRLLITLKSSGRIDLPLQAPDDQALTLDRDILWQKFRDCTSRAMEEAQAQRLFAALQGLGDMERLRDLPTWRLADEIHR